MSKAARSVFYFGIYLIALGLLLLLVPNLLLTVFGVPATKEVWIRVVGVLVCDLGHYYIQAARKELTVFFHWSIYSRSWVFFCFIAFVAFQLVAPIIMLFGAIDLLGAAWTVIALRSSEGRS